MSLGDSMIVTAYGFIARARLGLVGWVRRLLPIVLLIPLEFSVSAAQAQVSDAQVEALVDALRVAAPQTGRQNDGLYSEWKIKPDNITRWSRRCIGQELTPAQFEADPVTARRILVCVMGPRLRDQYAASNSNEIVAVQRAAAWWMTGDPEQYNREPTSSYTSRVLEAYLRFF